MVKINWSDFIRNAIRSRVREELRKNLAKTVLINEQLRRKSVGEAKAEEIIKKSSGMNIMEMVVDASIIAEWFVEEKNSK